MTGPTDEQIDTELRSLGYDDSMRWPEYGHANLREAWRDGYESGLGAVRVDQPTDETLSDYIEAQCADYMHRASHGGQDFETWITIRQVRQWLAGRSPTRPSDAAVRALLDAADALQAADYEWENAADFVRGRARAAALHPNQEIGG